MRHPVHESIVVINDTVPRSGAMNMALDEVLLSGLTDMAMLRCYRWQGQEVSFGCFGQVVGVENEHPGVPLVRRWTGGGIVEHGADFTFTLFLSKSSPLARLGSSESYRHIHAALVIALQFAGIDGLASAVGLRQTANSAPEDPPFLKPCFSNPVEHDLLCDGKKIAGGAQRRTRHGLMHQGSIQSTGAGIVFSDSIRHDLSRNFADALAAEGTVGTISDLVLAQARALSEQKYGSVSWTRRF